jgi:hypothetical protein
MLEIQPSRPLPLIDLHDIRTLAALELDERISVGDDYAVCQAWSAVIHERYPTVMGIRYRARKAGADTANVFLFLDRCSDALEIVSATRLDALEATVLRAADTYRLTVFFPFKP